MRVRERMRERRGGGSLAKPSLVFMYNVDAISLSCGHALYRQ